MCNDNKSSEDASASVIKVDRQYNAPCSPGYCNSDAFCSYILPAFRLLSWIADIPVLNPLKLPHAQLLLTCCQSSRLWLTPEHTDTGYSSLSCFMLGEISQSEPHVWPSSNGQENSWKEVHLYLYSSYKHLSLALTLCLSHTRKHTHKNETLTKEAVWNHS